MHACIIGVHWRLIWPPRHLKASEVHLHQIGAGLGSALVVTGGVGAWWARGRRRHLDAVVRFAEGSGAVLPLERVQQLGGALVAARLPECQRRKAQVGPQVQRSPLRQTMPPLGRAMQYSDPGQSPLCSHPVA